MAKQRLGCDRPFCLQVLNTCGFYMHEPPVDDDAIHHARDARIKPELFERAIDCRKYIRRLGADIRRRAHQRDRECRCEPRHVTDH